MIPSILSILGLVIGAAFSITVFAAPNWAGLIYLFSLFGLVGVAAAISIVVPSAEVSGAIKIIAIINLVVFAAFFVFLVGFSTTPASSRP